MIAITEVDKGIFSKRIELKLNIVLSAAGMWGKKKRAGQKEQFIPLQHRQDSKSTFDAQIDDEQSTYNLKPTIVCLQEKRWLPNPCISS